MSAASKPSTRLRKLERELDHAASYAEWLALASEHDRLSCADDWRASDDSGLLHVPEIQRGITTLRGTREACIHCKRLSRLFGNCKGGLMQRMAAQTDGSVGLAADPKPVPCAGAR